MSRPAYQQEPNTVLAFNSPCRTAPPRAHTLFARISCRSCTRRQATTEKQLSMSQAGAAPLPSSPSNAVVGECQKRKGENITPFPSKYLIIPPNSKIPYIT